MGDNKIRIMRPEDAMTAKDGDLFMVKNPRTRKLVKVVVGEAKLSNYTAIFLTTCDSPGLDEQAKSRDWSMLRHKKYEEMFRHLRPILFNGEKGQAGMERKEMSILLTNKQYSFV